MAGARESSRRAAFSRRERAKFLEPKRVQEIAYQNKLSTETILLICYNKHIVDILLRALKFLSLLVGKGRG